MVTPEARAILVIEDDDDLRDGLVELLRDEGYDAVGAANGRLALEHLAKERLPRLIVLDLMMPEMTGDEFRKRQLADPALSAIPVVILSAMHDAARTAAGLQVVACLAKPVPLAALLAVVREHAA